MIYGVGIGQNQIVYYKDPACGLQTFGTIGKEVRLWNGQSHDSIMIPNIISISVSIP